jgi:hypothetical protein
MTEKPVGYVKTVMQLFWHEGWINCLLWCIFIIIEFIVTFGTGASYTNMSDVAVGLVGVVILVLGLGSIAFWWVRMVVIAPYYFLFFTIARKFPRVCRIEFFLAGLAAIYPIIIITLHSVFSGDSKTSGYPEIICYPTLITSYMIGHKYFKIISGNTNNAV